MPDQVIQRARLCPAAQQCVLDVTLGQATAFQRLAHPCGDLLDQRLKIVLFGGGYLAEQGRIRTEAGDEDYSVMERI